MLLDIARTVSGDGEWITVPEPVRGSAPVGYISIGDDTPLFPRPLLTGVSHAVSRRIQSYNLTHTADLPGVRFTADDASDYDVEEVEHGHEGITDIVDRLQSMSTESPPTSASRVNVSLTDDIIVDNLAAGSEVDKEQSLPVRTRRRRIGTSH